MEAFPSPMLLPCLEKLTLALPARPLCASRFFLSLQFLLLSQSASWALILAPPLLYLLFLSNGLLFSLLFFFSFLFSITFFLFLFLFFIYQNVLLHHLQMHYFLSFSAVRPSFFLFFPTWSSCVSFPLLVKLSNKQKKSLWKSSRTHLNRIYVLQHSPISISSIPFFLFLIILVVPSSCQGL